MLIMKFTAEQIATYLHGDIVGDAKTVVRTFAKIEEGQPEAISFLANPKYESYLYETQSSIVLVNRSFTPAKPVSATLIKVDDAYERMSVFDIEKSIEIMNSRCFFISSIYLKIIADYKNTNYSFAQQ